MDHDAVDELTQKLDEDYGKSPAGKRLVLVTRSGTAYELKPATKYNVGGTTIRTLTADIVDVGDPSLTRNETPTAQGRVTLDVTEIAGWIVAEIAAN